MYREEALTIARTVALSLLNKPYLWGGDDPMAGFDCSGFCIEILKSVGLLPRSGDWPARGLWKVFDDDEHRNARELEEMEEGCLVFWHSGVDHDRIVHIEYALNNELTIGASGGGSANTDLATAIEKNAYIKVRPVRERNLHGLLYPFGILPQQTTTTIGRD